MVRSDDSLSMSALLTHLCVVSSIHWLLLQMDALSALFQSTRGDRWKDCSGWRAYLQQAPHRVAAADTDKRSSASPCGLAMDRSTKEVVKIQLCANNLSG